MIYIPKKYVYTYDERVRILFQLLEAFQKLMYFQECINLFNYKLK